MTLVIREMQPHEAESFLQVHHEGVHGLAAGHYPLAVLDDWAPLPLTEQAIDAVRANPDGEFRLVAEIDGRIVGIGALVIENAELRACYVAPQAARKGVGTALVRELERVAAQAGLMRLDLDSSLPAEPFYDALGYRVVARGEHRLRSGQPMACVKMCKKLAGTRD